MTAFKITWPTGLVTVEHSEYDTVDRYVMSRWGKDSADQLKEFGTEVAVCVPEEEARARKAAFIADVKASK